MVVVVVVVVVCKVIFMSNPTYIKLFWVVGCVVVLTIKKRLGKIQQYLIVYINF